MMARESMRIKFVLRAILLGFLACSVVTIVLRTMRESSVGSDAPGTTVIVYYFHGAARCTQCETIEAYSHEAVCDGFAEEMQNGRLQWRVLNYDESQAAALARQYEVIAPTVVLAKFETGKQVRWDNLSEVWALVENKPEFLEHIRAKVHGYL